MTERWGACICGCAPDDHDAVVLRPICVDPGNRVLFEGTLGRCNSCEPEGCELYDAAHLAKTTQDQEISNEPR